MKRGLLRDKPGGYGELDALHLVTLIQLLAAVGPRDTALMWPEAQQGIQVELAPQRIALVVDLQLKSVVVARDDKGVADAVRHGRPVKVLELGDLLTTVASAVRTVRKRLPTEKPQERGGASRAKLVDLAPQPKNSS